MTSNVDSLRSRNLNDQNLLKLISTEVTSSKPQNPKTPKPLNHKYIQALDNFILI